MAQLTQKERMLLKDQLEHEEICITKYSGYASRTRDPQIRNMFTEFAGEEQQHYDTINNLLQGGQGQTQAQTGNRDTASSQGQTGSRTGSQAGSYQATSGSNQQGWMLDTRTIYGGQVSQGNQAGGGTQGTQSQASQRKASVSFEAGSDMSMSTSDDQSMLNDMLMTEKYISGTYDTTIFEASNTQVRQALQHIQRDEQKHGEEIFKYMQQHGMYQTQ